MTKDKSLNREENMLFTRYYGVTNQDIVAAFGFTGLTR